MNFSPHCSVEFHSFHWDNFSKEVLQAHQSVMKHFGIPIQYTQKNIPHGQWLNEVLSQATSDIIVIIEPDLIPLDKKIVIDAIEYARVNDSFIGCAQVSNHLGTASHIFASPAFFVITKSCYKKLGSPSFLENKRSDVAEELSYIAEEKGIRYRTLFPTMYEKAPKEGCWPLASYGFYGIGTIFDHKIYHLFQSRTAENITLFVERCNNVINGNLDTSHFIPSQTFTLPPHVYEKKQKKKWYKKLGF